MVTKCSKIIRVVTVACLALLLHVLCQEHMSTTNSQRSYAPDCVYAIPVPSFMFQLSFCKAQNYAVEIHCYQGLIGSISPCCYIAIFVSCMDGRMLGIEVIMEAVDHSINNYVLTSWIFFS